MIKNVQKNELNDRQFHQKKKKTWNLLVKTTNS